LRQSAPSTTEIEKLKKQLTISLEALEYAASKRQRFGADGSGKPESETNRLTVKNEAIHN
jgi:hypothetical protein